MEFKRQLSGIGRSVLNSSLRSVLCGGRMYYMIWKNDSHYIDLKDLFEEEVKSGR